MRPPNSRFASIPCPLRHVPRNRAALGASRVVLLACAALLPDAPSAQQLDPVEVLASAERAGAGALAASDGIVESGRLSAVALQRPGDALEQIPGLIVTQHAGDGKANQYFLRGFNLDHGTDFAFSVAGVPVNMPSHAHGQGYADLNFLIPELIDSIHFRKGPYAADDGDFASAGSARVDYLRRLDTSTASLTLGPGGYRRALLAGSPAFGAGSLLYGFEAFLNDGPWRVPQNLRKFNAVLKYSEGSPLDGFALTAMAYRAAWTSTDQIPRRAVDTGRIDRLGSLDDTAGGRTERYSVSGEWSARRADGLDRFAFWTLQSRLDLWSNFQYCLNDFAASGGCDTGDQFRQSERRTAAGLSGSRTVGTQWFDRDAVASIGVQARADRLSPVGLYATRARETRRTVREDRVTQASLAVWAQGEIAWTRWLRTIVGLRADGYTFEVDAGVPANSGRVTDRVVSPKLSIVLGPWHGTEFFVNAGRGFHSNDARGTTISVDPRDPAQAVSPVRPLVPSRGLEIGVRARPIPGWVTSLAIWQLSTASELLFVGDAGTTEASRPSQRHGVEWSNAWRAGRHLSLHADFAWSRARFTDPSAAGNRIPGVVGTSASVAASVDGVGDWSGALRIRYLGPRDLIEDGSVRAAGSLLAHLRVSRRLDARTRLSIDVYNLFNRRADDIAYWYASQLRNEAAPVEDIHFHPAEPRAMRVTLTRMF